MVALPSDRQFFEHFFNVTGISAPLAFLLEGKWVRDKYLAAHVSDLYRLLVVHMEGGVYADMDSISVQVCARYACVFHLYVYVYSSGVTTWAQTLTKSSIFVDILIVVIIQVIV